jgi:hypothetical protein
MSSFQTLIFVLSKEMDEVKKLFNRFYFFIKNIKT